MNHVPTIRLIKNGLIKGAIRSYGDEVWASQVYMSPTALGWTWGKKVELGAVLKLQQ